MLDLLRSDLQILFESRPYKVRTGTWPGIFSSQECGLEGSARTRFWVPTVLVDRASTSALPFTRSQAGLSCYADCQDGFVCWMISAAV